MKSVILIVPDNLHARPAAKLSNMANKFNSNIFIKFNGCEVNAKSPISILSMCIGKNSIIELIACGIDEDNATREISSFIYNNFEN